MLDRYARLYTPVALVLAAGLWWWSGDAARAITMLIVFCPCVMVLATPTALVASIGNAALRGSLVRKGVTIEALETIDTVCFDKTGTLTHGEPRLAKIVALDGLASDEVLRLAAVAEKFSEHPLGRAVVSAAHARDLRVGDPDRFDPLPGLGVRAHTDGHEVLLGRPDLLAQHGSALGDAGRAQAEHLAASGATVVALAVERRPVGLLALRDTVRRDAAPVIARLSAMGIRTVLITGDNAAAAGQIAAEVGLGEVYADVLPVGKAGIVRKLQAQGRLRRGRRQRCAGAGGRRRGIAMGRTGTDLAIETADVTLLADELARVPHLLGLSRSALHAIRQNLVFSLGVLLVAAVPGILTPVTGALLHELSSIPVIANSARLIRRRDEQAPTSGDAPVRRRRLRRRRG